MNSGDYNADNICRALGLRWFCDPNWAKNGIAAIRVVLKPAFHREVVITLERQSSSVSGFVVAAKDKLSSLISTTAKFQGRFESHESEFAKFFGLFEAASTESKIPKKSVVLDGMGIAACVLIENKMENIDVHVWVNKSAGELTRQLIKYSWDSCDLPEIQNALRDVARYVDLEFPENLRYDQPSRQRINLMVLGTPDEREDFLKSVEKNNRAKKS